MPQIRKIPHSFPDKLKKIKIKKKNREQKKHTTQLVIKPRDRNNWRLSRPEESEEKKKRV